MTINPTVASDAVQMAAALKPGSSRQGATAELAKQALNLQGAQTLEVVESVAAKDYASDGKMASDQAPGQRLNTSA